MPWSAHTAATHNKYVKKEVNAIVKKKLYLAWLQDKGGITFDGSGPEVQWPVRYKRVSLTPYGDGDTLTFSQVDKHKAAKLPPRGYTQTQSINDWNRAINRGESAIVKLWADITNKLLDDFKYHFGAQLLTVDGNAAANVKRVHGFESLFGGNAGVTASSSGSEPVGTNGATYATINTTLATYGGSAGSGTFPMNTGGDAHYDFWTPPVIDYTSAITAANGGWQATTKTWINTGPEAIGYGLIAIQGTGENLDLVLTNPGMYAEYIEQSRDMQRIVVEKSMAGSTPVRLGFGNTMNQDGTTIYWDKDVPQNLAYGFTFEFLQLMCWQDQLIKSMMEHDLETLAERIALVFIGNLICKSPRTQAKWQNLGGT